MRVSFGVIVVGLGVACASVAGAGDAVGGDSLKKLITGFTGQGEGFTVQYGGDGKVVIKEGGTTYKGTWRINKDQVCNKIAGLADGKEVCRAVSMEAADQYRFTRADNGKTYVLTKQ